MKLKSFCLYLGVFLTLSGAGFPARAQTYPAVDESEGSGDDGLTSALRSYAQLSFSYVQLKGARADAPAVLPNDLPSFGGAELGAALLFSPLEDHNLAIGPRIGAQFAGGRAYTLAGEQDESRIELNTGVESTLWFLNAFGPGLAVDFIAPSKLGARVRVEPMFSVRIRRAGESGAWALRAGAIYDSQFKWGLALGALLQWEGVPDLF